MHISILLSSLFFIYNTAHAQQTPNIPMSHAGIVDNQDFIVTGDNATAILQQAVAARKAFGLQYFGKPLNSAKKRCMIHVNANGNSSSFTWFTENSGEYHSSVWIECPQGVQPRGNPNIRKEILSVLLTNIYPGKVPQTLRAGLVGLEGGRSGKYERPRKDYESENPFMVRFNG